jgi:hypothetical protein
MLIKSDDKEDSMLAILFKLTAKTVNFTCVDMLLKPYPVILFLLKVLIIRFMMSQLMTI